MTYYKQCRLRRGNTETVSWIPEQFAKEGRVLKLRNDEKEWEDGWLVVGAGCNRLPEDVVLKNERAFKEFSYYELKNG